MPFALQQLLDPTPVPSFLSEIYGRTYHHALGRPGRFRCLFTWEDLDRIIEKRWSDPKTVRMSSGGKPVPLSAYVEGSGERQRLSIPAFNKALNDGASLIIEDFDALHPPLMTTVMAIEEDLQEGSATQVFVAGQKTLGFGAHWDPYDVFALQVYGSRTWHLYRPTRAAPMLVDKAAPPGDDLEHEATLTLNDGDVLYLPRGWWHNVESPTQASAHVTVAVPRRTGVDYIGWLRAEMRSHDHARMDIPVFASDSNFEDHVRKLRDIVRDEINVDSVRRFMRHRAGHAMPRTLVGLQRILDPTSPMPDTSRVVRLTPRARIEESADGRVRFIAAGRSMTFLTEAAPLLTALLGGIVFTAGELRRSSSMDPEEFHQLLIELQRIGIVAITAGE